MSEEKRVRPAEPVKPISSPLGLMAHPLKLAAGPSNDIGIDPSQGRTQLRLVKVAVVIDPATDVRVVHGGQLSQGEVATVMKRPAPDGPANALQRLRAGSGKKVVRTDALFSFPPHRLPGSKLKTQKIERDDRKVAPPVRILAVDDFRLLRMQHQLTGCKAIR